MFCITESHLLELIVQFLLWNDFCFITFLGLTFMNISGVNCGKGGKATAFFPEYKVSPICRFPVSYRPNSITSNGCTHFFTSICHELIVCAMRIFFCVRFKVTFILGSNCPTTIRIKAIRFGVPSVMFA